MMEHQLKTNQELFVETWIGNKKIEIRFNDRDFQTGDQLVLKETLYSSEEMQQGLPTIYTGRLIKCDVTHIIKLSKYGLQDNWIAMSIDVIDRFEIETNLGVMRSEQ